MRRLISRTCGSVCSSLEDRYEVRAFLPDAKAADAKVNLQGNRLEVEVTHRQIEKGNKNEPDTVTEWGRYTQRVELAGNLKSDKSSLRRPESHSRKDGLSSGRLEMEQLPGDSRQRKSSRLSYHKLGPWQVQRKEGNGRKEYKQFVQRGDRQNELDGSAGTSLSIISANTRMCPRYLEASALPTGRARDKIFSARVREDRGKRDRKIAEAVEKYGYTQRSIAEHLDMHYSYISQIISGLEIT